MNTVLAIGTGGALGALSRYWMYNGVHALFGRNFPYGTLTVNVLGSLAIGFLYVWLFDRLNVGSDWRAFLVVGFLGAFTTFSAFSIETLNLMQQGSMSKSLVNIFANVVICVAAAWLGVQGAKLIS